MKSMMRSCALAKDEIISMCHERNRADACVNLNTVSIICCFLVCLRCHRLMFSSCGTARTIQNLREGCHASDHGNSELTEQRFGPGKL